MSSYKIEVDKNTGECKMIVELKPKQVSVTVRDQTVHWVGSYTKGVATPQKGETSSNLMKILKESIDTHPWEVVNTHIEETDQGPLVMLVCE